MKTLLRVYLEQADNAAQHEREEKFAIAATKWRSAFHIAPNEKERDWTFARAEYCFKRAIENGQIAIKKTRQLDFQQFMESENA